MFLPRNAESDINGEGGLGFHDDSSTNRRVRGDVAARSGAGMYACFATLLAQIIDSGRPLTVHVNESTPPRCA
jgi:hypothetical protein